MVLTTYYYLSRAICCRFVLALPFELLEATQID